MKQLFIGALVAAAPAFGQANSPPPPPGNTPPPAQPVPAMHDPWDMLPATVPYRNIADAVEKSAVPGQPSPLNPSCEGMTGDACVKAEQRPRG